MKFTKEQDEAVADMNYRAAIDGALWATVCVPDLNGGYGYEVLPDDVADDLIEGGACVLVATSEVPSATQPSISDLDLVRCCEHLSCPYPIKAVTGMRKTAARRSDRRNHLWSLCWPTLDTLWHPQWPRLADLRVRSVVAQ